MNQTIQINENVRPLFSTPKRRACGCLLPLIAAAFAALAFPAKVVAADFTDVFYGTGAGNNAATGGYDTAIGYKALNKLGTGSYNTASGGFALVDNTTGSNNTANGYAALSVNTTGSYNTATGFDALYSNTGTNNTANGASALFSNTSGGNNIASGVQALYSNTTGYYNTAEGVFTLYHNTIGHDNTGSGNQALFNNTSGNFNIALGNGAGYNLTTGSNNIDIGAPGVAGDANKIRIGKTTHAAAYIGGIYNKSVASASGVAVFIDMNGKLGTIKSSARYKEQIKPMDKASEAIHRLEPVTFNYKQELDPDGVRQFGLIAEQVEKVSPDLVVRDGDGKVSTVRYEAVNAMLLNEFLKEHRKVEQLEATVDKQEKEFETRIANQQKQIETLAAGLDKVSNQLKLSSPAPQLVAK